VHSCTAGVDVTVELFTYAVTGLTAFDTAAAEGIERIYRDCYRDCGGTTGGVPVAE